MRPSRFILSVQGEGRGHLTQAITVYELLRKSGHTIACVTVGISQERQIPEFFIKKINVPIITLASPNFTRDKKNRSVNSLRTLSFNMMMLGEYRKSLQKFKNITDEYEPDVVINFYEPLVGWFAFRYKHSFRIMSIAHQYTYLHPSYQFPPGRWLQSVFTRIFTKLTAYGSKKILAISMHDMVESSNKRLTIIPPILRNELFQQTSKQEDFLLIYLLNSGYIQDILQWHRKHPSTVLYCFTDSEEVKNKYRGEWKIDDKLIFYSLNDHKFLALMASCKGFVCNAGFESVCEARYLGKPVMMVPVKGHFEQFCNAKEGLKSGAGIYSEEFNSSKMENYLLFHRNVTQDVYKRWVDQMETIVLRELESILPAKKIGLSSVLPRNKKYYTDQLTEPSFSSLSDIPKD